MMVCATMRIKEWEGDVIFLHEVISGCADKSYGIHVGALAGLPSQVVERAQQVLLTLEQTHNGTPIIQETVSSIEKVVPLTVTKPSVIEEELRTLAIDDMTPRQALEELYRLKNLSLRK
jgi:DNA mismatch repair protein MutS